MKGDAKYITVPFRAAMVIVALDGAERFLKTNVVEAGKRCTGDVLDCVIRN